MLPPNVKLAPPKKKIILPPPRPISQPLTKSVLLPGVGEIVKEELGLWGGSLAKQMVGCRLNEKEDEDERISAQAKADIAAARYYCQYPAFGILWA